MQSDFIPVSVRGYVPVWDAVEIIEFDDMKQVPGVFLNLQPQQRAVCRGVLVSISEQERIILQQREKNYACVSLPPSQISGFVAEEPIITFIATDRRKIISSLKEGVIAQVYLNLLEQGLLAYDNLFQEKYRQQVLAHLPFPVKPGNYHFSDPLQNQLTREGLCRD
nr:hypothetical protein [uncultured Desulfobulbus sp.]